MSPRIIWVQVLLGQPRREHLNPLGFRRLSLGNCINLGIPAITTPQANEIRQGDELVVDITHGEIKNITQGTVYQCTKLPDNIMEMIREGGLVNYLKKIGANHAN